MRYLSECMRKGKHNHLFADIKIADEINQDQKEREREKKTFLSLHVNFLPPAGLADSGRPAQSSKSF